MKKLVRQTNPNSAQAKGLEGVMMEKGSRDEGTGIREEGEGIADLGLRIANWGGANRGPRGMNHAEVTRV